MTPVIYYESEKQIIIGVTLPDGRQFSIDINKRPDRVTLNPEGEILVSGSVSGQANP